ncbi:hypothetical protein Pogu_0616 [Pyrobaculum oguniense TE7]|uniref:Uncharacterized protein n=1 Tax=Pyrobaculum oguniense (strain DSM 13380 / JCM 10595 / TE7) TaxID=698757 RepID=H6Q7Y6_PYROT|nr:hypothetical protein Pogu_0616 [Pyrobaculum oguniense TE7]
MVTLYYTWDGQPARSKEEADWLVYYNHDYRIPLMMAWTNWRKSVSVYIDGFRESYTWWHIKTIRGWPAVLDVNTIVEMLLAREELSFRKFLEGRPFKPMSLYGKPEELVVDINVAQGGKWTPRTLSIDDLTPLYGVLPYGEEYGCLVFDAWGRRPELKRTCLAKLPDMDPEFAMLEGEMPGVGWTTCWLIGEDQKILNFYVYLNFRGYAIKILRGKITYGRKEVDRYDMWMEKMWIPNFNKAIADLLIRDDLSKNSP